MISVKREPTIETYEITLKSFQETDDESFKDTESGKTKMYGKNPLLWYNGIEIESDKISSLYLDTNGFFPRLQVYFYDETSLLVNNGFALDNTIISLYLDSRTSDVGNSTALRPIRMDFKIIDYGYLEKEKLFYIQGVPNIDKLYTQSIKAYSDKSSYEVFDEITEDLKLGFSSNISTSNDKMNWSNMNFENYQFIKDVTDKGYVDDNSFVVSFIDYYYSLNYINMELQFKEDIKEQQGLLTMNGNDDEEIEGLQEVADLFLISKDSYETRFNNTYDYYEVINRSTKVSLKNGYRTNLFYYDRTGNWEENAGTFLKFTIETNTEGKGVILKSYPDDTTDGGFFNSNTKNIYLPPLDIDNTHKNYNYADIINNYNFEEVNKLTIRVVLTEPNYNFYKLQKIKVVILETNVMNNTTVANQRLSGGWVIIAINFNFSPKVGLKQELIMVKREMNTNGDFDV